MYGWERVPSRVGGWVPGIVPGIPPSQYPPRRVRMPARPHPRATGAPVGAPWHAPTRSLGRPKEILGVDNAHHRPSRTAGTLGLCAGPAARPTARPSLALSAPALRNSQYFSVFLSISQICSWIQLYLSYISVISQLYLGSPTSQLYLSYISVISQYRRQEPCTRQGPAAGSMRSVPTGSVRRGIDPCGSW